MPVFDWVLPNVSHWANETHPRHGAGFYYGVPWRAATCTNVFCRGEARLARHVSPQRVLFALRAIISWHNVNKVLTENTPMAYLTGEACLA
ncbi:MAG: hypothetical protein ACFNO7_08925, partial [Bacteroides sp.]